MSQLYRQGMPARQPADKVLFWVPGGMPLMLHVEGPIAAALRLRGIDVHAVICDGAFRACVRRELDQHGRGEPVADWPKACPRCRAETSAVLKSLGIPYSFIGDFVPETSRKELWQKTALVTYGTLDSLSYDDISLGKNVRSAILRYLKGYDLAGHEEIVREYAFSALVTAAAAAHALEQMTPSRIFMSQGTYVDWGPALHTALSRGIPVTAWMACYLTARFYFRHVEDRVLIDFHNMSRGAWEECKNSIFSPAQETRLHRYLENRYQNHISFDMRRFEQYVGNVNRFRQRYALAPDKPVWGIMTHINWDCVSDYSPMAYDSFNDWILDTIQEIAGITDVQWLLKVHPGEAWDNPESGIQRLVDKHFPSSPGHVRIITAREEISPLDFYQLVDGGVTVYGTPGLELALLGKPVILAGEAHYGGRSFTHDGLTPESYRQLLRQAATLKPLDAEQQTLARRYAYCYFIQRQVPLPVVRDPNSSWWRFQSDKRELLLPGKDPFIDFICDRILDGKDFIMDERLITLAERWS